MNSTDSDFMNPPINGRDHDLDISTASLLETEDNHPKLDFKSFAFNSIHCASLPLVVMGVFILVVCVIFCCYLRHLRNEGRKLLGFSHVTYTFNHRFKTDRCPVCLEPFHINNRIAQTKCKHLFHRKCLRQWLEMKTTCPLCTTQLSQIDDTDEETSLV